MLRLSHNMLFEMMEKIKDMDDTYGKLTVEQGTQFVEELQVIHFQHPKELMNIQEQFESYVLDCLDKELVRLTSLYVHHNTETDEPWKSCEHSRWYIVNQSPFGLDKRELKDLDSQELTEWINSFINKLIYSNITTCDGMLKIAFSKQFEYTENEELIEDMIKYINLFKKFHGKYKFDSMNMDKMKEKYPNDEYAWNCLNRVRQQQIFCMYESCVYLGLEYSSIKKQIIERCETYYAEVK